MVTLAPMNEDAYNAYIKQSIDGHIRELMAYDEALPYAEARKAAEAEISEMLPNGLQTQDNFIMHIVRASDGQTVGFAWMLHEHSAGVKQSFLCDFGIDEAQRRNGYATAALKEMEAFARSHQCRQSVLFVRAGNIPAIRLYEKCGYVKTRDFEDGFYMIKNI